MRPFKRKVQYYETDMMGVTHHANYIHWMEEARIDFLEQLGFPYAAMEQQGVLCPVKSIFCDYKHTSTFDDEIEIRIWVESFTGLRMTIQYEMVNQEGTVACTARSEHFFVDRDGRFVRMKREMPEFCQAIEQSMLSESSAADPAVHLSEG